MPTPGRQFGQPMHLHDRFYGPVLGSLIQDLKSLGDTRLEDSQCAKILGSLERVCAAYQKLDGRSVLRARLLPELEALREFYHEWNDAHRHAPGGVQEYRRDRIFFMRKGRQRIQELVNKYQTIIETEFDLAFASQLFALMADARALGDKLPSLTAYMREAEKDFLPGSTSPRLARANSEAKKRTLDPVKEFRLLVRRLCGKYFETEHGSALDEWSARNLGSLSQDRLRTFRANFMVEFEMALDHRPPRLDQLQEFLDRCAKVLAKP